MEQKLKEKDDLIATLVDEAAKYDTALTALETAAKSMVEYVKVQTAITAATESKNTAMGPLQTVTKFLVMKVKTSEQTIAELNQYVEVQTTTIAAMESNNTVNVAMETATKSMEDKVEVQLATIAAMETEIVSLRQKVIELTHEDNKAHLEKVIGIEPNLNFLFLSNNTTLSEDDFNATTSSKSRTTAKTIPANVDKKFVDKMVRVATKLETKYATPVQKRVGSYFMRRPRLPYMVPEEFGAIYTNLALSQLDIAVGSVLSSQPTVDWSTVRFKPNLPKPEACPVHGVAQDPDFYRVKTSPFEDHTTYSLHRSKHPFGSLPGYHTTAGVVTVPTTPVNGWVYSEELKRWVLYASSTWRGSCQGGQAGGSTRGWRGREKKKEWSRK